MDLFRDAADSAPSFGDRKNFIKWILEVIIIFYREVEADIQEGADFIMVKPAMAYLDVIKISIRSYKFTKLLPIM